MVVAHFGGLPFVCLVRKDAVRAFSVLKLFKCDLFQFFPTENSWPRGVTSSSHEPRSAGVLLALYLVKSLHIIILCM